MDQTSVRSRAIATWVALTLATALALAGDVLLTNPPSASAEVVAQPWAGPDPGPTAPLTRATGYDRDTASRDTERGIRFRASGSSPITGLRFYRAVGDTGRHVARVWSGAGLPLRRLMIPASDRAGWQRARFSKPVRVSAGAEYAASFSVRAGVPYAVLRDATAGGGSRFTVLGGARGLRGDHPAKDLARTQFLVRPVFGSPAATTPPSSFPGASTTGVPDGVRLAAYTGPPTIRTDGVVIRGRQVDGPLSIQAEGVVIERSRVDGNIEVTPSGSLTISDSTVDGGTFDGSAVGQYHVTMRRVEVVGARQSVSCNQGCDIQDSWLHAQYMQPGSDWHGDGFVSNGGSDMVVRHNTLACDSRTSGDGGCSGAVALFADFDPITDVTIDGNLFTAGPAAYCLYGGFDPAKEYGGNPTGVVITDNVFQRGDNRKCASFGAVTAVPGSGAGNVFDGNVWDDGRPIRRP